MPHRSCNLVCLLLLQASKSPHAAWMCTMAIVSRQVVCRQLPASSIGPLQLLAVRRSCFAAHFVSTDELWLTGCGHPALQAGGLQAAGKG